MARRAVFVALAGLSLVLAPAGRAHVTASPPLVLAGGTSSVALTGPNERDEPMTGFAVTVPPGFRIVGADRVRDWNAELTATAATWSGGSLAPEAEATFTVEIESPPEPGPVMLEAAQLYADGSRVDWSVAVTAVPGEAGEERASLDPVGWRDAFFLGGLGLLVLATIALRVRSRRRSLQER